jgi:hypothetical protein
MNDRKKKISSLKGAIIRWKRFLSLLDPINDADNYKCLNNMINKLDNILASLDKTKD